MCLSSMSSRKHPCSPPLSPPWPTGGSGHRPAQETLSAALASPAGPFSARPPPGSPALQPWAEGRGGGRGGRRLYATGTSFVSAASRLSLLGSLIADPESPHPAIRCIIISDPWAEPESLLTPALSVTCCLFNSEQLFLPRPQPQSFLLRQTLIIQKLGREYF